MNPAKQNTVAKRFDLSQSHTKLFVAVLALAIVSGVVTGYFLASSKASQVDQRIPLNETQKSAQQDTKTFRDFAEGKIAKKPDPKRGETYTEGTHLLIREGKSPVSLTSSVLDLSEYEGKNVKVMGETNTPLKGGWLMDVGKIEVK